VESKTRQKLRDWVEALDKLTEEDKAKEAEVWCLSALDILLDDKDFQEYELMGEERHENSG